MYVSARREVRSIIYQLFCWECRAMLKEWSK